MEYGYDPLDFSSNANPIGTPKRAMKAIRRASRHASAYPDPFCRKLREALAKEQGLNSEHIICGNGAADIIYRLSLAFKPAQALVLAPTFAEYSASMSLVGAQVTYHMLRRDEGYALTESILEDLTTDIDIFYLCNPNNPTGLLAQPELIDKIEQHCRDHKILLVLDECFMGFVENGNRYTLRNRVPDDSNLIVLDAFTKLFGMAGVRLGYCITSNTMLIEGIMESGQPWPVSSLAQAAGIAAIKKDREYLAETRRLVATERTWLRKHLKKLGFNVFESKADYLFFISDRTDLAAHMRKHGILIRDCSNYPGLEPGAYRVAVRVHEENQLLIEAFNAVLNEPEGAIDEDETGLTSAEAEAEARIADLM